MTRYLLHSLLIHASALVFFFILTGPRENPAYYGFDFIPGGSSGIGSAPPADMSPPAPPGPGVNPIDKSSTLKEKERPTSAAKPVEIPDANKVHQVEKNKAKSKTDKTVADPQAKQKKKPGPVTGTQKPRAKAGTAPATGQGDTGGIGMGLDIGGVGLGQGAGGISKDFPYPWYVKILRRKLWEAWESGGVTDRECIVRFSILKDGSIDKLRVDRGSGDSDYDAGALRAVEVAAPFPPLPEGYQKSSLPVFMNFKFQQ
jgi:protein TonB